MLCSVIIPAHNKLELTQQCLKALEPTIDRCTTEVIVIDNGSTDGTGSQLSRHVPWVKIITNASNLGFACACNQGAAIARGQNILFLNNDTIPQPNWLEPLIDRLTMGPKTAVVGSKLLYEDGTIQHAGVYVNRLNHSPMPLYQKNRADAPHVSRPRELRAVTAACMLIRHAIFDEVGGFDQGYQNGFEDVDLCLKVFERGHRIFYEPRSVLYHLESKTPGRLACEDENINHFRKRWAHPKWMDEDLVYFQDGFRSQAFWLDGVPCSVLSSIPDDEERERWRRPAELQRLIHGFDLRELRPLLERPSDWPLDVSLLYWAERLCYAEGERELGSGFKALVDELLQSSQLQKGFVAMTHGISPPAEMLRAQPATSARPG